MESELTLLDRFDPQQPFPDVERALASPDGLLAVGGCLSSQRLINAYRSGIFPWYSDQQPLLWWSPDPRLILLPGALNISRSLGRIIRRGEFEVTFDRNFAAVIKGCALPRSDGAGTWITDAMSQAYITLHHQGVAHSVEAWYEQQLVGGAYGVAIGAVFFGESMFCRRSNASKVAFAQLVKALERWGYGLIDCQVHTDHLTRFGAVEVPRAEFLKQIRELCACPVSSAAWHTGLVAGRHLL